jgi:UDP-N-acetylmuramate dehydrogenase
LGGKARYFVEVQSDDDVFEAWRWANDAHVSELLVLGGGSNLLIADPGTQGLVLRTGQRGLHFEDHGDEVRVTANAGEVWDDLVRRVVERDLVGLECLSGIPGCVGATPIQNVGAYGQEIAQTLGHVEVFDRTDGQRRTFTRDECALAYRDSRFKSREPNRYIVLSVTFRLKRNRPEPLRNRELLAELDARGIAEARVADVRNVVMAVRARKSMLADVSDPLARSAGSFFVNPIVSREMADHLRMQCRDVEVPSWDLPDGRVKLAAAWLIEQTGFPRGARFGRAGLSPHHCLVVVAHARASATDVIALARRIRTAVNDRFGIELHPEPNFWGFEGYEADGLPVADDDAPRTLDSEACPAPASR